METILMAMVISIICLFCFSFLGPISYTLPGGNHEKYPYFDLSYDGSISTNNTWSGGLGQLTDGITADDQHGSNIDNNNGHDYGENDDNGPLKMLQESIWVGWHRDSNKNNTTSMLNDGKENGISLIFEFDQVYNFTSIGLICRNDGRNNIAPFTEASVWFSIDRHQWSQTAITFSNNDHSQSMENGPIQLAKGKFFLLVAIFFR